MPKFIKAALGVVAVGILIWVILALVKMAILLLPLAILVLVGYFGYKYLKAKQLI